MEKRVLYVASVSSHLKTFHTPYLYMLKKQGYEIHTAASGENLIECVDRHYNINFTRKPISCQNISAFFQLKNIINENEYTFIHCHTPAASVITRLAGRKARKKGTKIIYTAHGFHFYIGGPKFACFVYRMIEKQMSRLTDAILTINKEDYEAAKNFKIDPQKVFLTCGVGCNLKRFFPPAHGEKELLRDQLGFPTNGFLLIYPAELCFRKNQKLLLQAIPILIKMIPEIKLLLVGIGDDESALKNLTMELEISDYVSFLGRRNDVDMLMKASDLDVAASRQEGLGMHIVEALASGIPSVASRIRGHNELIIDGVNGFYFESGSSEDMAAKIYEIYKINKDPQAKENMRRACIESAKPFGLENALKGMKAIYNSVL